jgi:hypothetical protein
MSQLKMNLGLRGSLDIGSQMGGRRTEVTSRPDHGTILVD